MRINAILEIQPNQKTSLRKACTGMGAAFKTEPRSKTIELSGVHPQQLIGILELFQLREKTRTVLKQNS